jgi:5-methylcytosine-specific restriction endonuclease McrA
MPDAPKLPPIKPTYTPPDTRTTAERGYGTEHRKLRARLLALYPLCQRCGADWSHHLHHVDRDPFNRSPANCQMLCERCHAAVHAGR